MADQPGRQGSRSCEAREPVEGDQQGRPSECGRSGASPSRGLPSRPARGRCLMSVLVSADSISEAWGKTLAVARRAPRGRQAHVITAVQNPGLEIPGVREALDQVLANAGSHSVDTVAETIFPSSLYPDPGFDWSPDLLADRESDLDAAANTLYESYADILPLLRTVDANKSGTYFSRMITWPGKEAGGTNQLQMRVARLRAEARIGR